MAGQAGAAARIHVVVAVALSAGALATLATVHFRTPPVLAVLACLACTTCVGWRRQAPTLAVLVALVATVGYQYATDDQAMVFEPFAVLLTLYASAARGVARSDLVRTAVLAAAGVGGCALVVANSPAFSVGTLVIDVFPIVALPTAAGVVVARRRELTRQLAATNERLSNEQALRVARVAAEERTRIARELHDIVAHHMSVMVIQAGAARLMLADDLNGARTALQVVAASAHEATTELDKITDVLTNHDGDDDLLERIVRLVDRSRVSGLATTFAVEGSSPSALPAELELTVYRVIQEALTNAVKHARPASAAVRLSFADGWLEVEISNDGPSASPAGGFVSSTGRGLIGMRERVEHHGGTLHAGPKPGGDGYEIRVQLPTRPRLADASPLPRTTDWHTRSARWRVPGLTAAMLVVLEINAAISDTRRGPLILNLVVVAAMCLALTWRRRAPLLFLLTVLALAVPLSGGLASIEVATLVSTYVFFVPVWTVAAWAPRHRSVLGLAIAIGTIPGQGSYWHYSASSVGSCIVLTVAVWAGGRILRTQRVLAGAVEHARAQLIGQLQDRERLAVVAERSRLLRVLHGQVTQEVTAMAAHADQARRLASSDSAAAEQAIRAIEAGGHHALNRMRQVLGLLRTPHDPAELTPHASTQVPATLQLASG